MIDFFKQWLRIWEYGNEYHDYAYTAETARTVSAYYGEICRLMKPPRLGFLGLILRQLCQRRHGLAYNRTVARAMLRQFASITGRDIKPWRKAPRLAARWLREKVR
jgi:hypothetical protein